MPATPELCAKRRFVRELLVALGVAAALVAIASSCRNWSAAAPWSPSRASSCGRQVGAPGGSVAGSKRCWPRTRNSAWSSIVSSTSSSAPGRCGFGWLRLLARGRRRRHGRAATGLMGRARSGAHELAPARGGVRAGADPRRRERARLGGVHDRASAPAGEQALVGFPRARRDAPPPSHLLATARSPPRSARACACRGGGYRCRSFADTRSPGTTRDHRLPGRIRPLRPRRGTPCSTWPCRPWSGFATTSRSNCCSCPLREVGRGHGPQGVAKTSRSSSSTRTPATSCGSRRSAAWIAEDAFTTSTRRCVASTALPRRSRRAARGPRRTLRERGLGGDWRECAEALETIADRLAFLVAGLDEREPEPARRRGREVERRLDPDRVDGGPLGSRRQATSSSSIRRTASVSPCLKRVTCSFTCGPTTWVWTQMPPTPPTSRNERRMLSSPA